MDKKLLEVCCFSVQSALNAQKGGAHRVELCDNLPEGGTTPSYGTIALARELLSIKLHVIIRPRGGDFLYSDLEFEAMKRDIEFCKQQGIDGIVIGLLNADGTIDKLRTKELVDIARPMSVTFHRAFDMAKEPFEALEDLINIGLDRILTSGQEQTAIKGKKLIKNLIERAQSRIIILPGAGINEENIKEFAEYTLANEFHSTAKSVVKGNMIFRNARINMGGISSISEYDKLEADEQKIKTILKILNQL